jgi:hypothetical protein
MPDGHALDECLADLEWLPGAGYVLFILDAPSVLREESNQALGTFLKILRSLGEEWKNIRHKPLHILLQCEENDAFLLQQRSHAEIQMVHIHELN